MASNSLLSSKGDLLYATSDKRVMVLPVGHLNGVNRVQSQGDMVFRSSFCDRSTVTQQFTILDPGGNQTDFYLSPSISGIMV